MEKIIIIAHGSPKKEVNNLDFIVKELAIVLGRKVEDIKYAYLKYGSPSVDEAITKCVEEGAKRIIVHPFFLSSGSHVSFDIPKIIENIKKLYPQLEVLCTKPLGKSKKLVYIIKDLIEENLERVS